MSKFDKIFQAREVDSEENKKWEASASEQKVKRKTTAPKNTASVKNSPPAFEAKEEISKTQTDAPQNRRGRPNGKRSDPDFIGFTTYIKKDTHLKAKIALLQEGKGQELSELVEDLLSEWLKDK